MTANIVVLIALPEEHDVFLENFPVSKSVNPSTSQLVELEHEIPHDGFSLFSVLASDMGSDAANDSLLQSLDHLEPDLIVCLGIAGALSKDAELGDVCISSEIVDVLHNAKISDGPTRRRKPSAQRGKIRKASGSQPKLTLSPRHYQVNANLSKAARFLRSQPSQSQLLSDLKSSLGTRWTDFRDAHSSYADLIPSERAPTFHVGPIVCGPVSASTSFNKQLLDHDRKILAIETESGGVHRQCVQRGLPAITIRGISDKADREKGRLERDLGGELRTLAMQNACDFFRAMLSNVWFMDEAKLHAARLGGLVEVEKEIDAFSLAQERVEKHLKSASAEFKHRPFDSPLPLPRLQKTSSSDIEVEDRKPLPLQDALLQDRRIFLKIPRSYPEPNVAWYMAQSLFSLEIDERQVLPVVVCGSEFSPPSRGLRHAIGEHLFAALKSKVFFPVVIVDEPLFDSETKSNFLGTELTALGAIGLIVLSKAESPIDQIDSFKLSCGLTDFFTASMPISEMAGFLERSFDMSPEEADVVATRLDDTFSKFRLHAHPAYFVGLEESTLDELIAANQRAELIQLAVDGVLVFVVANDDSPRRVSRTTREEFLTLLAYEIRVNKKNFSQSELVAFAESFALAKALDLDAINFVRDFIKFGVVTDYANRISFSLPYLEAFLLAKFLISDQECARNYFDIKSIEFDNYTFDLYCELGPSDSVIEAVLAEGRNVLDRTTDEENILNTRLAVRPKALENSHALVSLASKLCEATEKMSSEGSSGERRKEKQNLIDARDAVQHRVGSRKREIRQEPPLELKDEFSLLDDLSRACSRLAMLLGAGVERISGHQKFEAASLLLSCSERFLHIWTSNRRRLDFNELRNRLLSDDSIKEILSEFDLFEDRGEEIRGSLSLFIDDQEMKLLSGPLSTIMHRLASYAGVPTLRPVVAKTQPKSDFEEFLRAVWLIEVDPPSGRRALKTFFQRFKGADLVRLYTSSHLYWRIFWHHWQTNSRKEFAQAANSILGPMRLTHTEEHEERMLSGHRARPE